MMIIFGKWKLGLKKNYLTFSPASNNQTNFSLCSWYFETNFTYFYHRFWRSFETKNVKADKGDFKGREYRFFRASHGNLHGFLHHDLLYMHKGCMHVYPPEKTDDEDLWVRRWWKGGTSESSSVSRGLLLVVKHTCTRTFSCTLRYIDCKLRKGLNRDNMSC